jgi:hypothetical protein
VTAFKAPDVRALVSDILPIGPVNVSPAERQWTGGLGGALLLAGLGARHRVGSLLAVAGGILLFRAVTGHCPAYTALGLGLDQEKGSGQGRPARGSVPPRQPAHGGWRESPRSAAVAEVLGGPAPFARSTMRRPTADDGVQEASEESFPASDPPSFMAGTGTAAAETASNASRRDG